jgi:serine/threonine protein kinase
MLTDFGIAHRGTRPQDPSTTTTGTAAYLSPEQARREEVGPASDIYALGLVLLECFTGELAYPGAPVDSALSRLIDDPSIPRSIGADWRNLLSAMTSLRPEHRPEASEIVLALRDLVMAETGRHRMLDAVLVT